MITPTMTTEAPKRLKYKFIGRVRGRIIGASQDRYLWLMLDADGVPWTCSKGVDTFWGQA